ncbi:hypothetical protein NQZ68_010208 [Dissostichus eleginoides]|nr:hypothetical protein NQZ68_010208 [Dissostichus eleginoides]
MSGETQCTRTCSVVPTLTVKTMLRWILGGREAQGSLEKSSVLCIGEEQPKNWFTELQVLKGHFDIVRFLVQIDDFRCASAGDDGLVLVWNVETGERLQELRGHSQQITAMTTFTCDDGDTTHTSLLTASSDRSLSLWDPDTGNRVQTISDLQSSVKCLLVLERLCVFVSGGGSCVCGTKTSSCSVTDPTTATPE